MREQALLRALADAMPGFRTHLDDLGRRRQEVQRALDAALALDRDALAAALGADGRTRTGARPTHEHEPGQAHVPHPAAPSDRAGAVLFAERVLAAIPAAYVDGSQVPIDPDLSVPFGMATIHGSHARPGAPLLCHDAVKTVGPADIQAWQALGVWNADQVVNLQRWSLEVRFLIARMEAHPGTVAVFDGSLVHSFTTALPSALRAAYDDLRDEALEVSRRTRSPLVGYVDNSRARDLVSMVTALHAPRSTPRNAPLDASGVTDAALLADRLARLGDRTPAWWCDRDDGSQDHQAEPVAFHYALLGPGGPCRIEYPAWVLDTGLHTVVHDLLLAQCLAHGGYPRSIDECHLQCSVGPGEAAAVQATFLRLAQEHGIPVQGSWKARSKRRGAAP